MYEHERVSPTEARALIFSEAFIIFSKFDGLNGTRVNMYGKARLGYFPAGVGCSAAGVISARGRERWQRVGYSENTRFCLVFVFVFCFSRRLSIACVRQHNLLAAPAGGAAIALGTAARRGCMGGVARIIALIN